VTKEVLMKKISIVILILMVGLDAAYAFPEYKYGYVDSEIAAIEKEMGASTIANLTIKDAEAIAGRISIAIQKERYVERSAFASMVLPGVGQFMNNDALGGTLFMGGYFLLLAGTLVTGYFLLPANVQFNNLDYLNTPLANIHNTWASNNLLSYLPTAGVLAGGMILGMVLRHFSSQNAAELASKNITDGKVTFEPTFSLFEGGRVPGFGFMMRMR
jgi:hypothetical protein